MNLITRGFGPPSSVEGRGGPVTQGMGGEAQVLVPIDTGVDWRWIELARLRTIEEIYAGAMTLDVVLANLGTRALPRQDSIAVSGGSRSIPVARPSGGNALSLKVSALRRKR
jgi:hypothetical protein